MTNNSPQSPHSGLTPLPSDEELTARHARFERSRRLTGLWLGFGIGWIAAACAQSINVWSLPGLPLYQVPPGMPWTAFIAGIVCALVGLITAWPGGAVIGVLRGSLLAALVFNAYALLNSIPDRVPPAVIAGVLFLILLPITAMVSVVVWVFRSALDRQQAAWQDQRGMVTRVAVPALLLLAAVALGLTARYPESGQRVLTQMFALVQAGQSASSQGVLPSELSSSAVTDFAQNGAGTFTLEWSKDPNNRYAIPRPANSGGKESIAIARFDNGYLLICLYPTPETSPECVSRWATGSAGPGSP